MSDLGRSMSDLGRSMSDLGRSTDRRPPSRPEKKLGQNLEDQPDFLLKDHQKVTNQITSNPRDLLWFLYFFGNHPKDSEFASFLYFVYRESTQIVKKLL